MRRSSIKIFLRMLLPLTLLSVPSSVAWCQQQIGADVVALRSQVSLFIDNPASEPVSQEQWTVLSVRSSNLHADPPVIGEVDTLPGFTREFIRVQWRTHDPVYLYVIRPIGVRKPPAVLYLYGYPTDIDKFRDNTFCQNATRNGLAAIGFVSALTGHRYHDHPMKEWFVSELQKSLVASVHDVQMVLDYLNTRGDLDMNRMGMYGQGSGGSIAILSTVADPRIKAVDVMDPWGDWSDWLAKSPQIPESERAEYLKPNFLAKVAPLDPVQWLPRLKGRPLRIQENLFNPASIEIVRQRIEASAPPTALIVTYRNIKEYTDKVNTNGKMLDWLTKQLQPPNTPDSAQPH